MLTAKDTKEDVIDGLNCGADDYLGKPFEPQEFIARVRAVLRRPRLLVPSVLSFGNVELRVGTNEAVVANNKNSATTARSLDPRSVADAKGPRCHTRRPDRGDLRVR